MSALALAAGLLLLASPAPEPRALAIYEAGKASYDAGRYGEALRRFDEAVRLQPDLARWHYNRGLALRKLGQEEEMRAAFAESRRLDPGYKRAEIDAKLGLPPAEATGTAAPDEGVDLACPVIGISLFVAISLLSWLMVRKPMKEAKAAGAAREQRLYALSARLAELERRFAAGEDAEARGHLDQATVAERRAYALLPRVQVKPKKGVDLEAALAAGEAAAAAADARLREALPGPAPRAPRLGCFFCARPLPNEACRVAVSLTDAGKEHPALVCQDCAAQAEAGRPPRVRVVEQGGEVRHWAEVEEFDPYVHHHRPLEGTRTVGVHALPAGRSPGELASLAAGGALLGGGVALVASQALDLDALREAAAAEFAAQGQDPRRDAWADQS